ncbi:MAG: hypothetical protein ACOYLE_01840 [Bacteroidales bacterium]
MKNALYVIAGLVIVIWIILFKPSEIVHLLLLLSAAIILVTIIFNKRLSEKK